MKQFAKILTTLLLLFAFNVSFALNPSRTYKNLPDKYNMVYEAFDVKTEDGATLKAWYFSAKTKTTHLILISHNGEGNMGDYLRRINQFIDLGYNVVTYDYRGFGESSEFEIDNNMFIYPHFQSDTKAMIDFCRTRFVQNFDMYGWGIGAGLSLGIGYNRTEICNIIADTPFLSMEDLEERFSDWDERMEVPFAGYEKRFEPLYALDNEPTISKGNSKRIQLIVGNNDILFNTEDMKTLYSKRSKIIDKNIYVVENPDRKDNFRANTTEYMATIAAFLAGS